MPIAQVINTARDPQQPSPVSQMFSRLQQDYKERADQDVIGNLIGEYQKNRENAFAWEDLQLGLEKSNISPSKRLETQKSLNEMRKNIIAQDKALNKTASKLLKTPEEREAQISRLEADGYPREEAEIYVDAPPSVQQSLERNHREARKRKERFSKSELTAQESGVINSEKPSTLVQNQEVAGEQNIPPETPKKEWEDIPKPPNMTTSERIKWENENEKTNTKKIQDVEAKKKGYQSTKNLIYGMTQINDSKKLPEGLGKMIQLTSDGDIDFKAQMAGLVNPETEKYVKNLKQFLKGAKEFFGSRITDFDVTSFMQQLPNLLNSEQGRRMILKEMELVNELESIHNNELDKAIKHYGRNANYIDISKVVDDKVALREKRIIGKINRVVEGSNFLQKMLQNPDKFRDRVLVEKNGEFRAIKQEDIEKAKLKEWEVY